MKYLKTYEGLFDFFRKDSEEDKIAKLYINRLKKVKGACPYSIKYKTGFVMEQNNVPTSDGAVYHRYDIVFDDTPITIIRADIVDNRYTHYGPDTKKKLLDDGVVFKNEKTFYCLYLPYPVEDSIQAKCDILEELYELTEKVYNEDKKCRKINKIKNEINPAADLLNDEDNV